MKQSMESHREGGGGWVGRREVINQEPWMHTCMASGSEVGEGELRPSGGGQWGKKRNMCNIFNNK